MLTTRPPVLSCGSNHFSRSWLFGAVVPQIYFFIVTLNTHKVDFFTVMEVNLTKDDMPYYQFKGY